MSNKVSLYFNNLLKDNEVNLKDVILIRHSKSDKYFKKCFDEGYVKEYTSIQKKNFAANYKYWAIFISDKGTTAKYYGMYEVSGCVPYGRSLIPQGYPALDTDNADKYSIYNLTEVDVLSDMKNRLVIDWGKATISWYQRAEKHNKEVLSIYNPEFESYDKTLLTFEELEDIVNEPLKHEGYVGALKNVKGVYLISDAKTGKQYVGAAYGTERLLGRWTGYIKTKHNDNKLIKKYLKDNPDGYKTFKFSILQIFSDKVPDEEVINCESLYKEKLLTREFGWNDN